MAKIKSAGTAGTVSYALTEVLRDDCVLLKYWFALVSLFTLTSDDAQLAFWIISLPLAALAVLVTTGSLPDTGTTEGQAALGGYSLAFLTFARAIVPARIALALYLTPWTDENIVSRFKKE